MTQTPPRLSPRQHQCMTGLLAHKRSKTIAEELGLSPKTVDNYIAEAVVLLGARDRADAAGRYKAIFGEETPPETSPEATPGEIPGGSVRVGGDVPPAPFEAPQPANDMTVGRGMERYSPLQRLGIIAGISVAIAIGLALVTVAVVGLIAIYETPRSSNEPGVVENGRREIHGSAEAG